MSFRLLLLSSFFIPSWCLFAGEPQAGRSAYVLCASCHGPNGEGNLTFQAPSIAGQETWYLMTQLQNYQKGIRGSHPEDTPGSQMAPMAKTLTGPTSVADVAAYIHSLKRVSHTPTLKGGDPEKGKTLFATCTACHNTDGKGLQAMNAPDLTLQQDWYLQRQLQYFKKGIRGSHKDDLYGQQMKTMSMLLADDKAILDVVAYIMTLAKP